MAKSPDRRPSIASLSYINSVFRDNLVLVRSMHRESGSENTGDHVMKQLNDNRVSGLEECFIAMFFICIVLLGMILHICVSMADFMRSWKQRAAGRAAASRWVVIPQQQPVPLRPSPGTELHGQDHPQGKCRRAGSSLG